MFADNPAAGPAERRAVVLNDLGIDPERETVYDKLFEMYGNNQGGDCEGMTFYHIKKLTLMIKMTHPMFEMWTDDMVSPHPQSVNT